MEKDVPGITAIYNHYVLHSIVPEDQEVIDEKAVRLLWEGAREEKLPFIVALKGLLSTQDRHGYQKRGRREVVPPQPEAIIGFAYADAHGYGIGGAGNGRSRYTVNLQLFVDHQYTRKGVGRSLLDRLLQTLAVGYAGRDGYAWINPKNDQVYGNSSGIANGRRFHQMLVELPIDTKENFDYPWIKAWLQKFYFAEVARLPAVARSSIHGSPARWLDVAIFQLEGTHGAEFDCYV